AARVYTVSSAGNSGSGSVREAVGLASAGDTIRFASSLSGTPILLSTQVSITKPLYIEGASGISMRAVGFFNRLLYIETTAISPPLSSPFYTTSIREIQFENANGVTLGGAVYAACPLTFYQCTFDDNRTSLSGGAIAYLNGSAFPISPLVIDECTFTNNEASTKGGAIYVYTGNLLVNKSTFDSQEADQGGAIYYEVPLHSLADLIAKIDSSDFSNNEARLGGALWLYERIAGSDQIEINDCDFSSNQSNQNGGAIYASGGSIDVYRSAFLSNIADSSGGASFATTSIYFDSCQFRQNTAVYDGGALAGDFGSSSSGYRLRDSELVLNSASRNGGGLAILYDERGLFANDNRIDSNMAVNGGGIYLERTGLGVDPFGISIWTTSFRSNNASDSGGGLYFEGDELSISRNDFVSNTANIGGGMYLKTPSVSVDPNHPLISRTTLRRNQALIQGGGIHFSGKQLAMQICQLDSNQAVHGAAIDLQTQTSPVEPNEALLEQCDFYGNQA
ncbi:MAG: hypothetical protein AAFP02_13450, partial [Bacteroidota bacterium]